MAENTIRLVKLTTGEVIVGKYNAEQNCIDDAAILQGVQTQEGMQMRILPYGFPFEQGLGSTIDLKHSVYIYKNTPVDIFNKYNEISANIAQAVKNNTNIQ